MKQNSDGSVNKSETSEAKVPGRTTGFLIMSVIIVLVAIFMQQQSRRLDQADTQADIQADTLADTTETSAAEQLAGFRSDAWYLPADPMLGFVPITAGSFIMGSNPALDRMAYENERWSDLRR